MTKTTVLSLPQMIDLALNTPEIGVVNFTVLHSLLHVIANYLGMNGLMIHYKDTDSEKLEMLINCAKPDATYTLTQYEIQDHEPSVKRDSIKIKEGERPPSIVLENNVSISKRRLSEFQEELETLKSKVKELTDLPTDSKLIEVLSDDKEKKPLLDIYQIMNLTKRLDAIERSVEKFATMLETVTRVSISGGQQSVARESLKEILDSSPQRNSLDSNDIENRVQKLESAVKELRTLGEESTRFKSPGGSKSEEGPTKLTRSSSKQLQGLTDVLSSQAPTGPSTAQFKEAIETLTDEILNIRNTVDGFAQVAKEMEEFKEKITSGDPDSQPLEVKLLNVESKVPIIEEQLVSLDNSFSRQLNTISNRIADTEQQLGELQEKIHLLSDPSEEKAAELNLKAELHGQLTAVKDQIKTVADSVTILLEERENRQNSFDVLAEQVELLKAVKADREDLEDALADKADACLINRKVSVEQFDQACGDMSRSIEEALAKLTLQEALWTHALDDLHKDIGSKIDRMELNPLKDFINSKLKNLQEKFKTLSALKKEHEAAGAKSKFLRNVNCISCDKDVVMRKEIDPSLYPKPTALPPTRSMGPYLAYELDQLRKQQKCLPTSKNLNMLENALLAGKSVKSPDHICNRYCGGSHTVTTPQQRVARVGHFLEQWGPEIAPANDTHIKGTDGQMYKARDDMHLKMLAAEKPPVVNPEQKPLFNIVGDIPEKKLSVKDGNPPTSTRSQN